MIYDLIVVGGGPAGIFASIFAKNRGKKVLLLEKMEKLGKKLLIAGSGQCNLTHKGDYKEFLSRYGENGKFLKRALYKYSPEHMKEFFSIRGLSLVEKENGKYFPESYSSQDVMKLLIEELDGVDVRLFSEVEKIEVLGPNNFLCFIKDDNFRGKNILVSTGGLSYEVTGSTGDGFKFAKNLGHKIIETRPALTPCYLEDYIYSELSGVSFKDAIIELYRDNKKIIERTGDLLLTHKNISGPVIIDSSRYIKKGDKLVINFTGKNPKKFEEALRGSIKANSTKQIKNIIIDENLSQRFLEKGLKSIGLDLEKKGAEVKKEEITNIIKEFCQKSFVISKVEGYNIAMATAGGIDLNELNKNTCESKLIKGLFFAGEVLDIDGDTGGFNIQAAYSTGALVAESI